MSTITTAEAMAMMAECFMEPLENLTPDLSRESVGGWDSMGSMMLIAELDERFKLELSANESRAMQRVGDVLNFLTRHGRLAD
ncbi:MAG: acyl carrier protein [Pseudomonadota bacterium]